MVHCIGCLFIRPCTNLPEVVKFLIISWLKISNYIFVTSLHSPSIHARAAPRQQLHDPLFDPTEKPASSTTANSPSIYLWSLGLFVAATDPWFCFERFLGHIADSFWHLIVCNPQQIIRAITLTRHIRRFHLFPAPKDCRTTLRNNEGRAHRTLAKSQKPLFDQLRQ